jgi:CRP-like cAMP-binding protein
VSDFFSYAGAPAPEPERTGDAPRAILGDLSSEEWEKFIGFAARRRYPAGAVVVKAGERNAGLCFVASGQVEVRGQPAPGARKAAAPVLRGEGEVLGLLSFLDGAPSGATLSVTAAGPAELLLLTPEALQQLAAWQPRIAMALLRDLGAHVAARLRQLQPGD